MPDLQGTVAVVTGASRGVGRGIARELGAAGATVYVTGRSVDGEPTTDGLPGTVDGTGDVVTEAGGEGIAVRCDHTVDAEVEALFDRVADEQAGLDLLVNNVWGGYEGYDHETFDAPFWEQPLWRWAGMFDAGVRAHFAASRLAAPLLMEGDDGGLVVNVSAGDDGKYLGNLVYDVSKAAIDRLASGMAHELRPHGVAALAVYPGFVRTERVRAATDDLAETESPRYAGRAVAALAADPDVLAKTGETHKVGDLAREYGFTDVDGTRPPPFVIDRER